MCTFNLERANEGFNGSRISENPLHSEPYASAHSRAHKNIKDLGHHDAGLIAPPDRPVDSGRGERGMTLTQGQLKELLHYDPETGIFTWYKWRVTKRGESGERVAGSVQKKGYITIGLGGKVYMAHRLAWLYMNGAWPKDQIDHINQAKADNRFANLREATNGQNKSNSKVHRNNRCGLKGVTFYKLPKKRPWQARIRINKELICLGYYSTAEEAHAAYVVAAKKYHGEFAGY